jgi:preprotein translocase subunit YajC
MFNFGNLIIGATATSTSSAATTSSTLWEFLPFVFLIVLLYFIMIRPQRKKEKSVQQMREAVQIGDSVITVGGVVGRVVSIKEDIIVIETGADRSKIQIKKWAIQTIETIHDSNDFQK